jgi:hypothetical protein
VTCYTSSVKLCVPLRAASAVSISSISCISPILLCLPDTPCRRHITLSCGRCWLNLPNSCQNCVFKADPCALLVLSLRRQKRRNSTRGLLFTTLNLPPVPWSRAPSVISIRSRFTDCRSIAAYRLVDIPSEYHQLIPRDIKMLTRGIM